MKNIKLKNIGLNAFMALPLISIVYIALLLLSEHFKLELSQILIIFIALSVYGNEVLKSSRMDYLMFKIDELEQKIK